MWLPKEERHLLIVYTVLDPNFEGRDMIFNIEDLKWALDKCIKPSEIIIKASKLRETQNNSQMANSSENVKAEVNNNVEKYMSWLKAKVTIESVNNRLRERRLIEYSDCGTGCYNIKMTLAGWDLGDKYNSW